MGISREDRLEKIAKCAELIGRTARSIAQEVVSENEVYDLLDHFQIKTLASASACPCPHRCCSTRIVGPYN